MYAHRRELEEYVTAAKLCFLFASIIVMPLVQKFKAKNY